MSQCQHVLNRSARHILYFRNSGPYGEHVTGSNTVAATFHVTFKNVTPYVSISCHVVLYEDTSSLRSFGWTRYLDDPSPQAFPVMASSSNVIGAASCKTNNIPPNTTMGPAHHIFLKEKSTASHINLYKKNLVDH